VCENCTRKKKKGRLRARAESERVRERKKENAPLSLAHKFFFFPLRTRSNHHLPHRLLSSSSSLPSLGRVLFKQYLPPLPLNPISPSNIRFWVRSLFSLSQTSVLSLVEQHASPPRDTSSIYKYQVELVPHPDPIFFPFIFFSLRSCMFLSFGCHSLLSHEHRLGITN
jgi:hypothetical protein